MTEFVENADRPIWRFKSLGPNLDAAGFTWLIGV